MLKQLFQQKKDEFNKVFDFYKGDISSIRTGRASPALVEDITVEFYGSKMKIKELANISAPEPKTLTIQPWDKNAVEPICGAIKNSNIGLNPAVDGHAIRLNIPPLTEERRKDFIKLLKQKTEEARIKIRRAREDALNKIQRMEKDGEISEDERFDAKEELQKIVDDINKKIEETEKKKEQELMTA
ncbi:MAG: ribosome recycling factor [Parcubacteria group bacterium Licking1014_17]|nr:MAG: ribosome recycling factor [Parcubacteria group bacterium Licking1014_17]